MTRRRPGGPLKDFDNCVWAIKVNKEDDWTIVEMTEYALKEKIINGAINKAVLIERR